MGQRIEELVPPQSSFMRSGLVGSDIEDPLCGAKNWLSDANLD